MSGANRPAMGEDFALDNEEIALGKTAQPFSDSAGAQPVGGITTGTIPGPVEHGYSFAGFRLDPDGTLRRDQSLIHLPPKELAALRFLLAHPNQIVSPLQLKQALWGDVHVTADSVPKCLSSLRARLEPESCIQTVYKRGYRFSAEVRRLESGEAGVLPRLAILPFATGYIVPEHLGPAIAEETIARLSNARYPVVSILARDSVFTLAQSGETAVQIGRALKADLVLTGTLSAVAAHFRLRAEMIRVADGTQVWVEDMLMEQNQTAGIESELVHRLFSRLGGGPSGQSHEAELSVLPRESQRASPTGRTVRSISLEAAAAQEVEPEGISRHREAYETFLRGRHEWQTLERHRMQDGLQHLARAAELDPSLIAAKVDLVHLCVTQAFYGFMSPAVAADLVHRTADSVPDLHRQAEAILPALGWVNFHYDRNLPAAVWAFSLSELLGHDPWITRVRVMFELSRHRFGEAIDMLHEALRVDPYSPWLHNRLAWALHLNGQAAESMARIQSAINLFPEHEGTALYGSLILAFNGEAGQAVKLAQGLAHRLPSFDLAIAVHAYALACDGRRDEAQTVMERLQWLSRERFVLSSFNPAVYLTLGDADSAIAALRKANEDRCPWFFQMLADPRLKPLHAHPEFQAMTAALNRMEAEAELNLPLEA